MIDVTGSLPAASASGTGSTAIGLGASALTLDTAVGYNAAISADGSVAVGANTVVDSLNSVAVGADSIVQAGADGSTALGQNARVQTGATGSVAIGQDSEATEANTVSVGSATNQRRITNVADGVNANDAVTVQQMQQFATSSSEEIGRLDKRIDDVNNQVDEVGALASAFSALVPNSRTTGNTQISLGLANYSGADAMAAGLFHYVSNNVLVNAGVSTSFSSGETATRAGVTFGF
jgi:autotransporter adhesin